MPGIGLACSYIENDVGGDCFTENVMLVNRVSGVWRAWKGGRRGRKWICIGSALRRSSPGNMRLTLVKNSM
jgi:hypothetical protein